MSNAIDGHQRSVRLEERQADINKITSLYSRKNPQTEDGPLRTHGNSLGTDSNRSLILNRLKAGANVEYIREEMSGLNSKMINGQITARWQVWSDLVDECYEEYKQGNS